MRMDDPLPSRELNPGDVHRSIIVNEHKKAPLIQERT